MLSVESSRESVERWLKTMGCTPVEQDDDQTVWHLLVNYPAKTAHQMHIVSPKENPEAVIAASVITVAPEHVKLFDNLEDEAKADFLFELRRTLNVVDVDFRMEGAKGPTEMPTQIQLSAVRYLDGLTLDSFARSVGAVFKMVLNAVEVIRHRLGSNGAGPSGRFDFRRMGL
jgi:hypothetical protein